MIAIFRINFSLMTSTWQANKSVVIVVVHFMHQSVTTE